MANGAFIQSKVARGLAVAAAQTGDPYSQYRPAGAGAPIVPGNLLGTLQAQFGADPALKFARGEMFGKPFFYGVIDTTQVQPGDYFQGLLGTFFLCDVERFAPPMFVLTNQTVSVTRMEKTVTPGVQTQYGGDVQSENTAIITGWPASVIILGTKSTTGTAQTPNDNRSGSVQIILPPSVPASLATDDIFTDSLGNRYAASTVEQTNLGWRVNADLWAL